MRHAPAQPLSRATMRVTCVGEVTNTQNLRHRGTMAISAAVGPLPVAGMMAPADAPLVLPPPPPDEGAGSAAVGPLPAASPDEVGR